jgi:hypothetical protein
MPRQIDSLHSDIFSIRHGSGLMSDAEPPADKHQATHQGEKIPSTVAFEHNFFHRVDDIYFKMDETLGESVAVVKLGDEIVSLPLRGIRREFNLADTPDGTMLTLLAKGLRYVAALRIGDPIPSEIIDRKASWEPEARHKQIAYHRLAMQVLGWLSGDEHVITDPEELLQVAGDPVFRKKINDAFGEAAEHLGIGRENKEQVTHILADLAHELSYIEAMRDQYKQMEAMDHKIQELRRLYGNSRSVLEVVDPCARLMERAMDQFRDLFDQADAQTGEIMGVLRNIDQQKTFIQDIRDDLHVRLLAWQDILDRWHHQPARRGENAEKLLNETYRFLAPRFMPVDEWAMMTKLQEGASVVSKDGTQPSQRKVKRLGGSMEWN